MTTKTPQLSVSQIKRRRIQAKNPAYYKELQARRVEKDPDIVLRKHLASHHKITLGYYDALWHAQHGKCAVCKKRGGKRGRHRLVVDHAFFVDPDTLEVVRVVRGLLCRTCNLGIGHLQDNPRIAAGAYSYLRDWCGR